MTRPLLRLVGLAKRRASRQTRFGKLFVTAVEKLNVATAARDPKQQEELANQAVIAFKKQEEPNVIVIE